VGSAREGVLEKESFLVQQFLENAAEGERTRPLPLVEADRPVTLANVPVEHLQRTKKPKSRTAFHNSTGKC
jgi:hypothetical protein